MNDYDKLDHPDILKFIFHPQKSLAVPSPTIIEHDYLVTDKLTVGARFHLAAKDSPIILFFHGNGEIAADYDDIGPSFTKIDLSFLAVDYRGYGKSEGSPSVSNMMHDSHIIFKQTKEWLTQNNYTGPIFIMGRSLGSACAIEIVSAYQEEISGLIVDSSFAVTLPLLMALGIDPHSFGITEREGFGNLQKISQINKPTFIIHAQFDQIIPIDSAELLQSHCQAKNKQFQVIPGADHNNIIDTVGEMYFTIIRQFIDKVLKIRPKRYVRKRRS